MMTGPPSAKLAQGQGKWNSGSLDKSRAIVVRAARGADAPHKRRWLLWVRLGFPSGLSNTH